MVYSCIGAEIEDSDGSSTSDIKVTDDTERSTTAISDAPADTRSNGHVVSSKQQTDRQMERIVPLTDARTELDEDGHGGAGNVAPCGPRPEPPPQSSKPSLAVMRQRHLQESLGTAYANNVTHWSYIQTELILLEGLRSFHHIQAHLLLLTAG